MTPPRVVYTCPACRAAGSAVSVLAGNGQITVTIKCSTCGHQWNEQRASPSRELGL